MQLWWEIEVTIMRLPDIIKFHLLVVSMGYGKPEELRECQYTIETVLELPKIIDKIVSIRGGTA